MRNTAGITLRKSWKPTSAHCRGRRPLLPPLLRRHVPRKKRRWLKGLLILLAAAARWRCWPAVPSGLLGQFQSPDDWQDEDYYYYDREQDEESAPITIPTVEPDRTARLTLSPGAGLCPLRAEVYRKVRDAVVTVAVELDESRMSVGTGVLFREDGYLLTNHHVVAGAAAARC